MEKGLVEGILGDWAGGLPRADALARVFEKVRDIPYGTIGSRDPAQVYLKNKGTCSGKHFLFFELVSALGFSARHFVCSHRFSRLGVEFPAELKEILKENDFLDYHNFVKVFVGDRWVTVDLTWDLPLKKYGFPVQEAWDGKSDTVLGVVPVEFWETDDPEKFKEEKIASMPQKEREARKLFIQKLSGWVSGLRKNPQAKGAETQVGKPLRACKEEGLKRV